MMCTGADWLVCLKPDGSGPMAPTPSGMGARAPTFTDDWALGHRE